MTEQDETGFEVGPLPMVTRCRGSRRVVGSVVAQRAGPMRGMLPVCAATDDTCGILLRPAATSEFVGAMVSVVIALREKFQVLGAVVRTIAVLVVDVFRRKERSSQDRRYDMPMLPDPTLSSWTGLDLDIDTSAASLRALAANRFAVQGPCASSIPSKLPCPISKQGAVTGQHRALTGLHSFLDASHFGFLRSDSKPHLKACQEKP